MAHCVILGHPDCRNKGDEAVMVGILKGLSTVFPDLKVFIPSYDPNYDYNFINTINDKVLVTEYWRSPYILTRIKNKLYNKIPLLKKLVTNDNNGQGNFKRAYADCLKKADFVIFSGKDLFCEDYGQKSLDRWMNQLEIAVDMNDKVFLWGVSPGPFSEKNEKRFKKLLDRVHCITAREIESYNYISSLSFSKKCFQVPDPAFELLAEKPDCFNLPEKAKGEMWIGFSISEGLIKYRDLDRTRYLNIFKTALKRLKEKYKIRIFLIPHVTVGKNNNDYLISSEFKKMLKADNIDAFLPSPDLSGAAYKFIIKNCDCFIATRAHTLIAALSTGVPAVSIAYSIKSYGIIKDCYGDANQLIDIKELEHDIIEEKIITLIEKNAELRSIVSKYAIEMKKQVNDGWQLFRK